MSEPARSHAQDAPPPDTAAAAEASEPRGVALADVVGYLDSYLRIRDVPDEANAVNGLEVENAGRIGYVVAAVDASQAALDEVVRGWTAARTSGDDTRAAPPLVIVHHGLFWDGNGPVTGRRYRRLRTLFEHDIALYAAHIPLDVHPEVGNNVVLARRLGVGVDGWLGPYKGVPLGVHGPVSAGPVPREAFVERLDVLLDTRSLLVPGGPETIERVAIITGAGSRALQEAKELGCDTFVTGEGPHHTFHDAMELGINLIYAGHYATEQVGVQALAEHLGLTFQVPWEFHWHPTGL